jgi:hypothetical protein
VVVADVVADAVLVQGVAQVGQDAVTGGDRLLVLPGLEVVAEGVEVGVRPDPRVAEQVPRSAEGGAGLEHGEGLAGVLGAQVARRADTGDAGPYDEHVEVLAGRPSAAHERLLPPVPEGRRALVESVQP